MTSEFSKQYIDAFTDFVNEIVELGSTSLLSVPMGLEIYKSVYSPFLPSPLTVPAAQSDSSIKPIDSDQSGNDRLATAGSISTREEVCEFATATKSTSDQRSVESIVDNQESDDDIDQGLIIPIGDANDIDEREIKDTLYLESSSSDQGVAMIDYYRPASFIAKTSPPQAITLGDYDREESISRDTDERICQLCIQITDDDSEITTFIDIKYETLDDRRRHAETHFRQQSHLPGAMMANDGILRRCFPITDWSLPDQPIESIGSVEVHMDMGSDDQPLPVETQNDTDNTGATGPGSAGIRLVKRSLRRRRSARVMAALQVPRTARARYQLRHRNQIKANPQQRLSNITSHPADQPKRRSGRPRQTPEAVQPPKRRGRGRPPSSEIYEELTSCGVDIDRLRKISTLKCAPCAKDIRIVNVTNHMCLPTAFNHILSRRHLGVRLQDRNGKYLSEAYRKAMVEKTKLIAEKFVECFGEDLGMK